MGTGERMLRQSQVGNATITNATGGTTPNATPGSPSSSTPTNTSITNTSVKEEAVEQATEITNGLFQLFNQWLPRDVAKLLVTVLVVAVTWYAAKFVTRWLEPRVTRRFERPSVSRTVLRAIRTGILGLGILFVIANVYGIQNEAVVLPLTVFSATAGVVLAPIVGSVVSGLFLLADQPYEVGDMIELDDTEQQGFVQDITIRYTKIATLDNTTLVIPNGSMRERDVVNYSAEDARTRLTLDIGVTYECDTDAARTLIEDAANEVNGVISGGPAIRVGSARYPAAPTCYISEFGAHSVELQLRYWITEPYKRYMIRSRVLERIVDQLEESDVELAYPHSHLVFDETSGVLDVSVAQEEHLPNEESNGFHDRRPEPNTDD